jgi:hypothetical protein
MPWAGFVEAHLPMRVASGVSAGSGHGETSASIPNHKRHRRKFLSIQETSKWQNNANHVVVATAKKSMTA